MARNEGIVTLEDAEFFVRNFTGIEREYNPAGSRNFCVFIDDDLANTLRQDGWNVKLTKDRGDGEPRRAYLPVAIGYNIRPPRIVMISYKPSAGGRVKMRTEVPEALLGLLDWVDVENLDMTIRGSRWEKGGNGGVKAYVRSLYLTVADDALEQKYGDIEEYHIDPSEPMLQLTEAPHDEDDIMDLDSVYEDEPRQIGR